jgi:hypothetical protein
METIDDLDRCFSLQGNVIGHSSFPKRTLALKPGDRNELYRPCRKIYQGGDDLSFVCDARIGLSMTAALLRHLREAKMRDGTPETFRRIAASAGIAFVKYNYPFSRAAAMAAEVQKNAKVKAAAGGTPRSTIDWWLNRSGATTRPEPLYGGASQKPYLIDGVGITWQWLERALQGTWSLFGESRGKFKDLLAAAESGDGRSAVDRLLKLRPLDGEASLEFLGKHFQPNWFDNNGTPLLDIGEIFDVHFPIFPPNSEDLNSEKEHADAR